jgi:hypothetical protein
MVIKIIKKNDSDPFCWYNNKIGETFFTECVRICDGWYVIEDEKKCILHIRPEDCEEHLDYKYNVYCRYETSGHWELKRVEEFKDKSEVEEIMRTILKKKHEDVDIKFLQYSKTSY